jgi:hypothetical protein
VDPALAIILDMPSQVRVLFDAADVRVFSDILFACLAQTRFVRKTFSSLATNL